MQTGALAIYTLGTVSCKRAFNDRETFGQGRLATQDEEREPDQHESP